MESLHHVQNDVNCLQPRKDLRPEAADDRMCEDNCDVDSTFKRIRFEHTDSLIKLAGNVQCLCARRRKDFIRANTGCSHDLDCTFPINGCNRCYRADRV